jgi:hypothetical protein
MLLFSPFPIANVNRPLNVDLIPLEQLTLKIANNCLNTNIYSYLETSDGQSLNLYLNVVHFFNTSVN